MWYDVFGLCLRRRKFKELFDTAVVFVQRRRGYTRGVVSVDLARSEDRASISLQNGF